MIIDTLSKYEILEAIIALAARNFPDDMDGDIAASFNEIGEIDIHFYPISQDEFLLKEELLN